MVDSETQVLAVIGNPVRHSLGPAMHNAALRSLNLNYTYLAFEVNHLKAAIEAMKELGFRGYSVTIPHKEKVIKHLDRVDQLAANIRAVNTVVNEKGLLVGYNTDAKAAVSALKGKTSLKSKRIALLGAGGAARAIAFALKQEGCVPTIFNRTFEKGKALAKSVGCEYSQVSKLQDFGPEIIINSASVGMYPNTNESPVGKNALKKASLVFDIIYNPVETRLLREARAAGIDTLNGVEMFVLQGAEQFRLWTGKQAPLEVMKGAVIRGLGQ